MNRPKENKEECCCEGTITREGAIHTKNSCCVYIENKEERHEHSMLCNGRNFGEGNKYFYGGNYTGMKEPENCDCKSEAPQTPELKGNKFTWSPEKAEELQKICDSLNKTPDSMEERVKIWLTNHAPEWPEVVEFIEKEVSLAQSSGRREERQFILNILDGIDKADEEMGNRGGGTKAIRHALESRIID